MYEMTDKTPFGNLKVRSNGEAVIGIEWAKNSSSNSDKADDVSRETWKQINEYCAGERMEFNLPLALMVSPSLKRWLEVLACVPFGTTISYKDLAKRAKKPDAPRAAGSACARNPIPLIIPCHRILRHDGQLGNFGAIRSLSPKDERNLSIKQALINHEAKYAQ